MSRVVEVVDAACTADCLAEARAVAGPGAEFLCLAPAPDERAWSQIVPEGRVLAVVSTAHVPGRPIRCARPLGEVYLARCWSASAGRRLAALRPKPGRPALVVRPGRPASEDMAALVACAGSAVVAAPCRDWARGIQGARPRPRVEVIAPPTWAPREAPGGLRRRLGVRENELAVLAGSPPTCRGGHRLAIWAASILAVADYPVRLILPAGGTAGRKAREFADAAGFGDRTVLADVDLGPAELAAACDLALFVEGPALPPVALAAAMAAGAAVVAAGVPPAADWLAEGRAVLLNPKPTAREVAAAAMDLIDGPSERRELGRRAREFAATTFDLEDIRRRWDRLIAEELNGRASGEPLCAV
jgi:hypothetical protein